MNPKVNSLIILLVAFSAPGLAADVFIAPSSSIEDAIQKAGPHGRVFLKAGQYVVKRPVQIPFPIMITADPVLEPGSVQIQGGGANFPIFLSTKVSQITITNLNFVPASGLAGADRRGQGGTVWQAVNCSDVVFSGNRVYNFQTALRTANCTGVVNTNNVVR